VCTLFFIINFRGIWGAGQVTTANTSCPVALVVDTSFLEGNSSSTWWTRRHDGPGGLVSEREE